MAEYIEREAAVHLLMTRGRYLTKDLVMDAAAGAAGGGSMICPECNGKGEVKYYREVDRDENSVTVEGHLDICHTCHGSGKKTVTNADHIRAMTDEELDEFLCDATYKENEQGYPIMRTVNKVWWHKWLKQPYKEGGNG